MLSHLFFFNDTATTEIYTLSLHDALPISLVRTVGLGLAYPGSGPADSSRNDVPSAVTRDRKSTRLNSSHLVISYAVFCLKKKNNTGICYNTSARTTTIRRSLALVASDWRT